MVEPSTLIVVLNTILMAIAGYLAKNEISSLKAQVASKADETMVKERLETLRGRVECIAEENLEAHRQLWDNSNFHGHVFEDGKVMEVIKKK
jgi:hypothetical protein